MFVLILSHFWYSVVTSVRFNSTLSNVEEKNLKKKLKSQKTQKISRKKREKIQKNKNKKQKKI